MLGQLARQQHVRRENINRFAELFIDRSTRSTNSTVPSFKGKRLNRDKAIARKI